MRVDPFFHAGAASCPPSARRAGAIFMKRSELIAQLVVLGWRFDRMSGSNHELWRHPKKRKVLFARLGDIIPIATAERLLEEAVSLS